MMKFNRNYQLSVETQEGNTLTIELPFTIEFDITRNTLSSANVCQVRLYNLSERNRNQIFFNAFNQSQFRAILLKAGYGTNLSTVFTGNISQAWSVREGVNFITQIECYDGGYAFVNGNVDISFPAGTPIKTVVTTLMGFLPNVSIGAVGNFTGVLNRANTYSGNAAQLLFEITGGAFFIDQGKAYALQSDEYVPAIGNAAQSQPTILISDQTGLLNTPVLEQTIVRFEMLFEPSLNVGRLVFLQSTTNPNLNGFYKITAVKHRGMISSSMAGSLITIGEFVNSKENIPVIG
jgi:hypothetical protein